MKRVFVLVLAVLTLGLTACSSDDGGSSGGVGEVAPATAQSCVAYQGTYYFQGGSITVYPDCTGTMRTREGNAKLRARVWTDSRIDVDYRVISGPYTGECGNVTASWNRRGELTGMSARLTGCRI